MMRWPPAARRARSIRPRPPGGLRSDMPPPAHALPHSRRLRHNHATNFRREFGLKATQILLGHSKADVTQIYAQRDMNRAAGIATKIG